MKLRLFKVSNILLVIPFSVITITPFISLEPISLPKFSFLTLFVLIYGIYIIKLYSRNTLKNFRFLFISLVLFLLFGLNSVLNAQSPFTEDFFGNFGRQIGYFTYVLLSILLLASALITSKQIVNSFVKLLSFTLMVTIFYCVLQILKLDPITWSITMGPIIGFFGNPNFLSAFLGMTSTVYSSRIIDSNQPKSTRFFFISIFLLTLYVIFKSESQQGFLVLFITNLIYVLFFIKKHDKYKVIMIPVMVIAFTVAVAIILDLLQKSFWKSVIYEESVSFRGDFWRAGINLAKEYPFIGVGFSGFKDNFLKFRDSRAAMRLNKEEYVDSAHNIFIDILASGGFLLFAIYLIIIIYVTVVGYKTVISNIRYNPNLVVVYCVWIGYLTQAVISIEFIGIAVVGWVAGGILVGYSKNEAIIKTQDNKTKLAVVGNKNIIFGLIISGAVFLPQLINDTRMKSSIETGNVNVLIQVTQMWPQDTGRINFVSRILIDSKLYKEALIVAKTGVEHNPLNYIAWLNLNSIPDLTKYERSKINKKLLDLNPFYDLDKS